MKQRYLYLLAIPKSLLFNFRYFPLRIAIRLPVLVSHRVWLMRLSGNVIISDFSFGAVKIGFGEVGIFDQHRSRAIWQVSGTVEFKGRADIGHGSKLSVDGKLIIGNEFVISAESAIVAHEAIVIGDQVLIAWDCLIMDTDLHKISDADGVRTNSPSPVVIGNKVWIGCRSLILKGVRIADGVVVAAASTVSRSVEKSNAIVAGDPARVVKENIRWEM